MIPKVVQAKPNPDFTVYVYFADGNIKLYDMKPLLAQGGVFQKISAEDDFISKCTVMNGTLAWDLSGKFDPSNCLDVDPVTIYSNGISVSDPLENVG